MSLKRWVLSHPVQLRLSSKKNSQNLFSCEPLTVNFELRRIEIDPYRPLFSMSDRPLTFKASLRKAAGYALESKDTSYVPCVK